MNCSRKTKVWHFQRFLHGIIPYYNGIVYEGELANNEPNGQGKLTWPDGVVYSGEFTNGHLSDSSYNVSAVDGKCYEGDIAENLPHGKRQIEVY